MTDARAIDHQALRLYEYHIWANNKVIGRLKEMPEEVCRQGVRSVFPSLTEALTHILVIDTVWLGTMRGENAVPEAAELRESVKGACIEQLEKLYAGLAQRYKAFLAENRDLDKPYAIEHLKYGKLQTTLAELVQHVVNHGTYHRGNVTAMLRQLGYPGVPTDYVDYLYAMQAKTLGQPKGFA